MDDLAAPVNLNAYRASHPGPRPPRRRQLHADTRPMAIAQNLRDTMMVAIQDTVEWLDEVADPVDFDIFCGWVQVQIIPPARECAPGCMTHAPLLALVRPALSVLLDPMARGSAVVRAPSLDGDGRSGSLLMPFTPTFGIHFFWLEGAYYVRLHTLL